MPETEASANRTARVTSPLFNIPLLYEKAGTCPGAGFGLPNPAGASLEPQWPHDHRGDDLPRIA